MSDFTAEDQQRIERLIAGGHGSWLITPETIEALRALLTAYQQSTVDVEWYRKSMQAESARANTALRGDQS